LFINHVCENLRRPVRHLAALVQLKDRTGRDHVSRVGRVR
jgi:hypothetical protein